MMLDLAQNSPPKEKIPTLTITVKKEIGPLPMKNHPYSLVLRILQMPTTQLAKMSIDPKFVEITADVLEIFFTKYGHTEICSCHMHLTYY